MNIYGKHLAIKTFKAGETIIHEGENGDSFFILYSGEVLVSSMTPSGDSIALATVSDTQNIFFAKLL
ncbi:MAG: cyclic nucleotide-binding domain-containing protein [Treponema sp.]|nr:cyclic nucleotide-binding domain-containing protein [Treponema sp.]